MKWLLIFALSTVTVAQNITGANTRTIRYAGAPTGACAQFSYAVNNATGDFYDCKTSAWFLIGPSAGSGTVTSFSSGNLSPLFTTSVATPTTTPALSFSLSSVTQNTVFAGSNAGGTVAPTFRALVSADLPAGTGTVTSIATTSPITGGTITSTGTIAISANGITATQLATQYAILRCYPGLGDGLNAIAAGTYLQTNCYNNSGVTWTITRIGCFTDNTGTSTLNATNGAGTGLLTGAVTCTTAAGGAAGTQSGTTTIANTDVIKFTFVADGTSKQSGWFVTLTQ